MNILFITPYSSEGASNRYRVEQYLFYLTERGIKYHVSPFVSSAFYKIIYKKGYLFKKLYYFLKGFMRRIQNIVCLSKYDVVFIHREACPFGPPLFEWLIYKFGKTIIFDFDDAIFMGNFNPANRFFNFFKLPSKTKQIIKTSSTVIVANKFLDEYARKFNDNVYILPTSIDTDRFRPIEKPPCVITIGWIGSPTTTPYLKLIYNVMRELSRKYEIIFKVVGADKNIRIPGVKIENCAWTLKNEINDFQSLDIGVYPMPDNLWTQGKAGFKAIQYMSVGVPVVASSVGVVKEIIKNNVNGFLADSKEEWVEKISRLIEDADLRKKIGFNGRKTVEEKFSIKVNVHKYLEIIQKAGA